MFGRAFPLSTRTNFIQSSTGAPPRCGAIWTAAFAAVLSSACTLAYDSDRKQCAETSDCLARGFAGATCVENVCQASTVGMDGGAGTGDSGPAPVDDTGPGNYWSPDAAPERMDATAGAIEAGSGGGGDASAPETGAVCQGAGCPECSTNADCERRGIAGGVCADSKCWAKPPMPECDSDDDCTARGLTIPDGWLAAAVRRRVLFLVEGASDVITLTGAGLPAIGRPSNLGGVEHLAQLLHDLG